MLVRKLQMRLQLSGQTPFADGALRMARRCLAGAVYEYGESQFFDTDRAPGDVAATRRAG
jgi:hypothetical protein